MTGSAPPPFVLRTPRGHSRPWISPSALGLVLMAVAVGLELDALADPNLIKMALAALALSLTMGELLGMVRRSLKLQVVAAQADPVRAGDPFALRVTVANRGRTDTLVRLSLEGRHHPETWAWVPARGQVTVPVQVTQAPARGRHPWPPLRVRIHGALGMAHGHALWVPHAQATPLRVWPAIWSGPVPLLPMGPEAGTTARWATPGDQGGTVAAPTAQTGPEGWLREWRAGDRLGHIAHKASAKRDRWLVRTDSPVAAGGGEVHLTLAWALAHTGNLEAGLSLLGRATEVALAQGHWVSLSWPGGSLGLGRGRAHLHHLLDALSEVTA